ncbi:MAG: polyprenol monophosphomannose synthase [Nitrospinae bacterium]|nr:polyprenol monophosphomannose synthase [Nitrospinota bacterium]
MTKTLVMIPTYNEKENIGSLLRDILRLDPPVGAVVVDDDSPDGTSQVVEAIQQTEPRVRLLTRKNKKGRGTAGIDGFLYALDLGADLIVEMDSDYSHHPRHIPQLVDAMRDCDVAIGSRAVEGGGESGRGCIRQAITGFAGFFIRQVMGLGVKDCTSGFRCFKREVLQSIGLKHMVSQGPEIVEEVLYACHLRGYKIKEIPIHFEDRVRGESTKTFMQYADTMLKIVQFRLTLKNRLRRLDRKSGTG